MHVKFVGTGEAFDESRTNTSLLVDECFLIDCGYSVPIKLWREKIKNIKYVFVSHFHFDHVGGLPSLLMRMRQEGRGEKVVIIGEKGFKEKFLAFFDLCYKGFFADLPFDVDFVHVSHGDKRKIGRYRVEFASGKHLQGSLEVPILAVRVNDLVYSGDTIYSKNIVKLAKNSKLLVHEAYLPHYIDYHSRYRAHCSPLEAGRVAREAGVDILALVHLHRDYVKRKAEVVTEARKEFDGHIIIPEDGDEVLL